MCTYRHKAPNGVYYFRMGILAEPRPFMGGRLEIKHSLRTKDRVAAKELIPNDTIAACRGLRIARVTFVESKAPPKSITRLAREQREHEQWQAEQASEDMFARDMEMEELGPVMDKLAKDGFGACCSRLPSRLSRSISFPRSCTRHFRVSAR